MSRVLATLLFLLSLNLSVTSAVQAGTLGAHQRISRVLPGQPFGDGRDGSKYIITNTTQSLTARSCAGTAGAYNLGIAPAGFTNGDVILIHQTRGANAGRWEINKVSSGGGTTNLVMSAPLYYSYQDAGADQAQVVLIPQYNSVTVYGNMTWRAADWTGDTNGFLIFAAKDTVTMAGTIMASGTGYLGYPGPNSGSGTKTGYCGEGTAGPGNLQLITANGNGGGAGQANSNNRGGGGSGGNGVAGEAGHVHNNALGGEGGTASGTADLTNITFGGAGGSGATFTTAKAGKAGDGGGIVMIFAKTIASMNALANDGLAAGNADGTLAGASSGGAGGSTLIVCGTAALGSSVVTAAGGTGNTTDLGTGKTGAIGRIAVHHGGAVTGTTNPPLVPDVNLIQDSSLASNTPPDAPSDPRCEGQTNPAGLTDQTPEFSWTFTDPDAGHTQGAYQILIGTTSANGSAWDSGKVISASSSNVSCGTSLAWGMAYKWRVRVWDEMDEPGNYCSEQSFSLQSPPTAFDLVAPLDDVYTSNPLPEFQWSTSTDPEGQSIRYTLQVSLDAGFTDPVYLTVTDLTATAHVLPAGQELDNGAYYWRVIASDGASETVAAQAWRLTVDTIRPLEPVLTSIQQDLGTNRVMRVFGSADPTQSMTFYHRPPGSLTEITLTGLLTWEGNSFTFDPDVELAACSAFRVIATDPASNAASSDTYVVTEVTKNVFQDIAMFHGSGSGSSMRLERTTAYPFKIAVSRGTPVVVAAWLRKNVAYIGAQPSLTLTGPGIAGTGAATRAMTVGAAVWERVSVTGTPDADGVLTFTVETFSAADGSATWIDDVSVSY